MEKYIQYLDGYHHVYVCMKKNLLEDDDAIMARIGQVNGASSAEKDMVVLCEWHENRGFSVPLTCFAYKEQIPDYDNVMKEMRHVIFVPLHMQDMVFGYMVLDMEPEVNDFSQISGIATNLSHCLDSVLQQLKTLKMNMKLQQANDKLEKLYITDPLTGIYNRRGFYQELNHRLKTQKSGWLMMMSVDMDGLKMINDQYGHSEGDFAIKAIGKAVQSCSEENGVCARFGGDEFTVALFVDEYNESVEASFKKKIYDYLDKVNEEEQKPYRIAVSCGSKVGKIDDTLDHDALLKDADNKMYVSKEKHHNRSRLRSRSRAELKE